LWEGRLREVSGQGAEENISTKRDEIMANNEVKLSL
jgi:hypothetical protein